MVITLTEFFLAHGGAILERRDILPFHEQILLACEQWACGSLPHDKRNLAICMPPRHGKTYIARDLVAWGLGHFPDSHWIYTASSATLAVTQTLAIRDTCSRDWYHDMFPSTGVMPGKGRQDYFTTAQGGSVYGVGMGGTITGFGAGCKRSGFGGGIVIDDPLQAADAYSQAERDRCNRWYTQTLYSRRNSDWTPVLLIMQRLHEDDLVGYLKRNEPHLWHIMEIPVRDAYGCVLWPETFSQETASRLEQFDPFAFSAQYMQQPTPPGGALFPRDKLLRIHEQPSNLLRAGIFADTAMKQGELNDWSVLTYAATDGQKCYVLDLDRGKWTAPELLEHAVVFWERHKPHRLNNPIRFLGMYVEDKASGTGLIQTLRAQTSIPVIAVQRGRDKVSRAHDVLPYVMGEQLLLMDAPWTEACIQEMCAFSPAMTHRHDDQVDCIIDALDTLLRPDGGLLAGADWS